MERQMKSAPATAGAVAAKDEGPPAADDPVREDVMAYWRELGLSDPSLVQSLADECLAHARRRVSRDASEELLRRALEDVQRRLDHALARALGLPPSRDQHPLSAARAAFLLAREGISADALFLPGDAQTEMATRLREALPHSTPPEAELKMKETPLRFWLFKSTHR
jgi:AcrR family transcriptional regulator